MRLIYFMSGLMRKFFMCLCIRIKVKFVNNKFLIDFYLYTIRIHVGIHGFDDNASTTPILTQRV